MKPTEKRIELAERLQKVGLCQGAEKWIRMTSCDGDEVYEIQPSKHSDDEFWFSVGPLATFGEVWAEIQNYLTQNKFSIEFCHSCINIVHWVKDGKHGKIKTIQFDDITEAATEALLYLHGEKQ